VGYHFDPQLDRFVVFPHQLPSTAFSGEWKAKWEQCFGPFEVQPTSTGDTLRWMLVNGSCDVVFRTSHEDKGYRITVGGSVKDLTLAGGARIAVKVPGTPGEPLPIEVQLDPSAGINGIIFTDPQPWFQGLTNWRDRMERLNLIRPLQTQADAPSIVGGFNRSRPHLIAQAR
jgi:hypothetical protein